MWRKQLRERLVATWVVVTSSVALLGACEGPDRRFVPDDEFFGGVDAASGAAGTGGASASGGASGGGVNGGTSGSGGASGAAASGAGGAAGGVLGGAGAQASDAGGVDGKGGELDATPDPCVGVDCSVAPEPVCADPNTARNYQPGTCSTGTCLYPSSDVACAFGCTSGACNADPCAGVMCDTPPPSDCVGNAVRTYRLPGTCVAGACSYPSSTVSCGRGRICADGFCEF